MAGECALRLGWLCVLCGACAGSDVGASESPLQQYVIELPPLYSAFGGSHSYALTPFVGRLSDQKYSEVDPATIAWELDERFVEREDFPQLPHALKLTTKRVGVTQVALTARNVNGRGVRATSVLTISEASDAEWDQGEARYSGAPIVDAKPTTAVRYQPSECGLPDVIRPALFEDGACTSCHNAEPDALAYESTPTQLASYSDDALGALVSQGEIPPTYNFLTPVLGFLKDPACGFAAYHKHDFDADTLRGLVLKLRSLSPVAYPELDLFLFGALSYAERAERTMKMSGRFDKPLPP